MLAYPAIPGINYLTNTIPYLNAPWVDILPEDVFELKLIKAEETKPLPVIVISKAPHGEWFSSTLQWQSIMDCSCGYKMNKLLADFVSRHPFEVAFDDSYFIVLKPKSSIE